MKPTKTDIAILETVRSVEERITSIDRDLEKDRQNLQNLTIKIETLEAELKQVRQAVNLNAERVRDKVADVTDPVVGAVQDLKDEIHCKKTLVVKEKKISIWEKILGVSKT